MTDPEPIPPLPYESARPWQARDASHLNLLATFHYVGGALILLFACFPLIHVTLGLLMVSGKLSSTGAQPGPPPVFGWLFVIVGLLFVVMGWAMGVLIIYSGRCIRTRRNWMFSLVMAGLMCMSVPIGTALGVFTFVVLLRDSVKRLYGINAAHPAGPPY